MFNDEVNSVIDPTRPLECQFQLISTLVLFVASYTLVQLKYKYDARLCNGAPLC